jgi:hypothetical protein
MIELVALKKPAQFVNKPLAPFRGTTSLAAPHKQVVFSMVFYVFEI